MKEALKKSRQYISDPRTKLERLLVISGLLTGYTFIFVYQNMLHIKVESIDLKTLIGLPVTALVVIPLIKYLIVRQDALQRSPSKKKAIRFFQNEFPSKYLLDRCQTCAENEDTCPNYIAADSFDHIRYWFHDIFHGRIEKEDPSTVKDTFEKGYTCKLIYYFSAILSVCVLLSIALITFHHTYLLFTKRLEVQLTPFQILYPLACTAIIVSLRLLHNPDQKKPSGCWHAWREINGMHRSWLKRHEDVLVNVICQAGKGTKRFKAS